MALQGIVESSFLDPAEHLKLDRNPLQYSSILGLPHETAQHSKTFIRSFVSK
jgi:hypothetical protein